MTIVPVTPEIITRFYGSPRHQTVDAVAILDGDEIVGIAGLYQDGVRKIMFSDLTDKLRKDKRTMVKAYRVVLDLVRKSRIPVQSLADKDIEGSDVLLEHMGFEHQDMGVYQWPR